MNERPQPGPDKESLIGSVLRFCLERKLVVFLLVALVAFWGVAVAPFAWHLPWFPRSPVPVDAIPDIGENQQIVFTPWMGRSPQDVEDQITYPLTVALLGMPGVKTVRSYSMFGFSTIYVIFKENVDFYWSRSRVLEKLSSLPPDTLPAGVSPSLGPDATALGQIYWYTLEGRDAKGRPTGGWDLDELRSIQDWDVRYALMSADGVSEVASVGGYVKEYQINVDPDAMRAYHVTLEEVASAVRASNVDVGARTLEINKVEYVIRGLGFIKSLKDIEETVVKVHNHIPVRIKDVAHVGLGPASRRGALDKEGAQVVGGVVVVRYGENPLSTIENVKKKIAEIAPSLPKKTLADGTVSQVQIVPFYDRTGLINETLGTLNAALLEEILITVIVILAVLMHFRSSLLVSGLLPLAVLMTFIAMKLFGVEANIVALSGIAIAIGVMVDMGIVLVENIVRRLDEAKPDEDRKEVIHKASVEVAGAVLTAVAATILGFLPVFTMVAAEGKLFKPLAFTKTFAMVASLIVAVVVIPPMAEVMFVSRGKGRLHLNRYGQGLGLLVGAGALAFWFSWWLGLLVGLLGGYILAEPRLPARFQGHGAKATSWVAVAAVSYVLSSHWLPLGPEKGEIRNYVFVLVVILGLLGLIGLFLRGYPRMLRWSLAHKKTVLAVTAGTLCFGLLAWFGFDRLVGQWLPGAVQKASPTRSLVRVFPGLGREFMPPLDEGSFLYMPTAMPHASITEMLDILQTQDAALGRIPEIASAVGKLGRADTPLDPAPISMIETIINYKPEYLSDAQGRRLRFRYDADCTGLYLGENGAPVPAPDGQPYKVRGCFPRDKDGRLIPDADGNPFRTWRPALDPDLNPHRKAWAGIRNPDDIWQEIVRATAVPGATSAPKLQPIMARIVMLQSGMRAPMGVKVKGPTLDAIEKGGLALEAALKKVPSVEPSSVFADRVVGKPYIEIAINRRAIARYGLSIRRVQNVIEVAVGGNRLTTTVEGRERYPVRVRYARELRDNLDALGRVLVSTPDGAQVPLTELAEIRYVRGPQVIKSEDTFLVGYVIFDKKPGFAETNVVDQAKAYLAGQIAQGGLELPQGVSYSFAGSYENEIRADKRLAVVMPLALLLIFLVLYFQFSSVATTGLVFSSILVAWAGGFILIWLYGQPWFLHFSVFGVDMRQLFQVHPINLSVAIWVGFLALFGIASDNGVLVATFLDESFAERNPRTVEEIREATVVGAVRRVRPALMTSATAILALIPVLTSHGRGADIMVPMAIPSFGGMCVAILTVLLVPVLYCMLKEWKLRPFLKTDPDDDSKPAQS